MKDFLGQSFLKDLLKLLLVIKTNPSFSGLEFIDVLRANLY